MNATVFLKLWGASLGVMFLLDMAWLGAIAKNFYKAQLGQLMRPDVQWLPAVLFYLIYVAARSLGSRRMRRTILRVWR